MKVILREDVPNLGASGTVVNVKTGKRTQLLDSSSLAAQATSRNIKLIEHKLKEIQNQIDVAKAGSKR